MLRINLPFIDLSKESTNHGAKLITAFKIYFYFKLKHKQMYFACRKLNFFLKNGWSWTEPPHDKTNKMTFAPSQDSDQPGHPPSLIRVFAVHMKKHRLLSYPSSALWRLWSDWADVKADLSLHWTQSTYHFVGFVIRRPNYWTVIVTVLLIARKCCCFFRCTNTQASY